MANIEQMNEFIEKFHDDAAMHKEIEAILKADDESTYAQADKWLNDNGYQFSFGELMDHIKGMIPEGVEIPLDDDNLEAVAGGMSKSEMDMWFMVHGKKYFEKVREGQK